MVSLLQRLNRHKPLVVDRLPIKCGVVFVHLSTEALRLPKFRMGHRVLRWSFLDGGLAQQLLRGKLGFPLLEESQSVGVPRP